ncbi:MAG: hypothetical protein AB8H79_03845 [Myxococcota bacterium]
MRVFTAARLLVLGSVLTVSPAFASPTGGHVEGGDHAEATHDDAHGDAAHGDDHGEGGHAVHHSPGPWEDSNGNGTVNFMDAEDEHFANSWGHPVWLQWVWHLLNLTILLVGLVLMARKPVAAALRDRFLGIKKDLDESAEVEQAARTKFEELEQRLVSFEDEVAKMKADAANAAAIEKEAAAQRARDAVVRVAESAQRTIRDETARATRALRSEAVELAVNLAEQTLRNEVGAADRQRLARDLLSTLGSDASPGGPRG